MRDGLRATSYSVIDPDQSIDPFPESLAAVRGTNMAGVRRIPCTARGQQFDLLAGVHLAKLFLDYSNVADKLVMCRTAGGIDQRSCEVKHSWRERRNAFDRQ